MAEGTLNPWLHVHLKTMPAMLSCDFSQVGLPVRYLLRTDYACRAAGTRLLFAYLPYYGTVHPRYAEALVALGMDRQVAERLPTDTI